MATRITEIIPFLLITLLCVGFVEGGYLALEHLGLSAPVEKTAALEVAPEKTQLSGAVTENRQPDYQVILDRNLFGPPPGKDNTATKAVEEESEDLQTTSLNIVLMGTVGAGDGDNRAIILDKSTNKQQLYAAGDAIQGASIKEIRRGKVILVYNGKDEMLDMSDAAQERATYAAPIQQNGVRLPRRVPRVVPGAGTGQAYRPQVAPAGTPRRVINRPRAIRPSRIIRKE